MAVNQQMGSPATRSASTGYMQTEPVVRNRPESGSSPSAESDEHSTAVEKIRDVNRETARVIAEHPLPSALTAFGIGLVVGLLGSVLLGGSSRGQEAAITKRVLDAISNRQSEFDREIPVLLGLIPRQGCAGS
jgi:ElaB/YqjD/DUF883 family membrane-anchored ribosome-binding protein